MKYESANPGNEQYGYYFAVSLKQTWNSDFSDYGMRYELKALDDMWFWNDEADYAKNGFVHNVMHII